MTSDSTTSERQLDQSSILSRRIVQAANVLFADHSAALHIQQASADYDQQCRDIVHGRGIPVLTIAVIGAKGQGKTWVARQLVLDSEIRERLPSGVLTREATTQLHWIGSVPPPSLDANHEKFIYSQSTSMIDLGLPYMLLDTPGTTDANPKAAEIANTALSISPIQILVIRRDQLRSATTSPLAHRSEGVVCIPIITCIPVAELNHGFNADSAIKNQSPASDRALQSDLDRWLALVHQSAPQSNLLTPILIDDFEATGDENTAGKILREQLIARLRSLPLDELAQTMSNRLNAAGGRLKHQVHRILESEMPRLAQAVSRLQEEADSLPRRAIESVLGSPIVLETAIRARMRAQVVADTSPLCFPYRTTLSLLSFTQGAWDRLILAMTGSIPSVFGTFVAWARNVQQSRKIDWDMQQGLRERLNGQVHDQLTPCQNQFHRALAHFRGDDSIARDLHQPRNIRLNGIDELQARSRMLFEQMLLRQRPSRWLLLGLALIGMLLFWGLLAGPIVSIYRQYVEAAYESLTSNDVFVKHFDHPSLALMATSVILSTIPMMLFAMLAMTTLLRRSKIEKMAKGLQAEHHALVDDLQQKKILRLEFEDPLLENAQYLLSLDSKGNG